MASDILLNSRMKNLETKNVFCFSVLHHQVFCSAEQILKISGNSISSSPRIVLRHFPGGEIVHFGEARLDSSASMDGDTGDTCSTLFLSRSCGAISLYVIDCTTRLWPLSVPMSFLAIRLVCPCFLPLEVPVTCESR